MIVGVSLLRAQSSAFVLVAEIAETCASSNACTLARGLQHIEAGISDWNSICCIFVPYLTGICITLIFTCVCALVAAYCQETTKANEPITKAKKPGSQEALRTKARKAMKQKTTKAKKPWPCLRFSNVGPGVEALVDFLPYLFGGLEVLLVRPRWARAQPALQRFLVQQLWPCVIRMSGAVNLAGLLWCHGLGSF